MRFTRAVIIGALAVNLVAAGMDCFGDNDLNRHVQTESVRQGDQTSSERSFPIAVPPASEVLSEIRRLKHPPSQTQEKKSEESPQARMLRQFVERRSYGMPTGPQLLLGLRQLPEYSPQHAIGIRRRDHPQSSVASPGSRIEWGINLKTHRFETYYSLNRFGNTALGLSLGRGKRTLRQYYKSGPNYR